MTIFTTFCKVNDALVQIEEKADERLSHLFRRATHIVRHPSMLVDMGKEFLRLESAGGILLFITAVAAIICANSPLGNLYHYFFNEINFRVGFSNDGDWSFSLEKSLLLWINDGLMVIFFFMIGLEMKREMTEGALSKRADIVLPLVTAIGGMAIPSAIYLFINQDAAGNIPGWAIPAATDIAFALGILALLGKRVPIALKVLLLSFAVLDDIGAITIIALFYSHHISTTMLIGALVPLIGLFMLNRAGVVAKAPYIILGILLWVFVLKSGVHATLAGLIVALFIPMYGPRDKNYSPVKSIEHGLHPWVAFVILPMFAFANAGVSFSGLTFDALLQPLPLGIAAGLVLGKQVGLFGAVWLMVKLKFAPMPDGLGWAHIYGMAVLGGIGFTMSLFIGSLAFGDDLILQAGVRLGVLVGSVISAVLAYMILLYATRNNR